MDSIPRPVVSAERDRELDIVAMQMMLLMPSHDLGECLIVRDKCRDKLQEWLDRARADSQLAVKKAVSEAEAVGVNVIRLPRGE